MKITIKTHPKSIYTTVSLEEPVGIVDKYKCVLDGNKIILFDDDIPTSRHIISEEDLDDKYYIFMFGTDTGRVRYSEVIGNKKYEDIMKNAIIINSV